MSQENASNNTNTVDQPARESTVTSFRDRTMERLGDHSPRAQEQEVISDNEAVETDAHQSSDPIDEDLQPQTTLDDGYLEVDDTNVGGVFEEQDIPELRQRAEEAESLVTSMQSDYTRKTQKLGESRRELLTNLERSEKIAKVYADRVNQNLNRWQNVNWQQLQSTLDPQEYNQRVNEYRQVVSQRDRAVTEHEQISKFANETIERQKLDEAEISRDVLRSTVPGWGNELYGNLREHASNALDFSAEEFDQITDHRVIKLIHNSWAVSQSGQKIDNIQQNGSRLRAPNGGPNKERPRGADGRYRKAQQLHLNNPGDKVATREAFRERLHRERTQRR